jgi:hypothetical protein
VVEGHQLVEAELGLRAFSSFTLYLIVLFLQFRRWAWRLILRGRAVEFAPDELDFVAARQRGQDLDFHRRSDYRRQDKSGGRDEIGNYSLGPVGLKTLH